jgi:16S rRNA (uracil1498-N3)-methyltransferase
MPRFFIEHCHDPAAASLTLGGDDFHHIRDVLRLKAGDQLTVCDGCGCDLACRIGRFGPDGVELTILAIKANQTEPVYQAILYQGLAKGEKMDTIIQKAVELGASRIVPVVCRRSVARLDKKDTAKKVQRWNRIAAEAAKQCGRGLMPTVGEPLSFSAAVSEAARAEIRLIPWENERVNSLRTELEQVGINDGRPPVISVMIGPEGGFDAAEIAAALVAGIRPVSLGRRILRTETAGVAALAMIMFRFDDF